MIETQETVHNWIRSTFPGGDPDSPRKAIRMLEEAVELCIAAGARLRDIERAVHSELAKAGATASLMGGIVDRPGSPNPDKVPAEAADVLITLYGLAGERGFDLHAEASKKMAINRHGRQWVSNGDGTGYHIKES